MIKPQIPNIPGVGMVTDTLDFVKNLWDSVNVPGMSIPGMVAPTLSLEELDKRITDLKTVESWLTLNLSMLRGTIQALEVQRGTIATLKSMSASVASAVKPGAVPGETDADNSAAESVAQMINPLAWWNGLQEQFKQALGSAVTTDAMAKLGAAGTAMATDAVVALGAAAAKANMAKQQRTQKQADAAQGTKPARAKPASRQQPDFAFSPETKTPAVKKTVKRKAPVKKSVKPIAE